MSVINEDPYPLFSTPSPQDDDLNYVIDYEKKKIVDFAIQLGRPLLVEGEAGCGKTRLAYAIAKKLELDIPYVASVRSTSRANDLLYRFDAVRRLQDSQIQTPEMIEKAAQAHRYVTLQPLGRAIFESGRKVVLIDEVDKADMDFPNDLLHVLDLFEFQIDEIPASESAASIAFHGHDSTVKGKGIRPVVVFTSNREHPLPKPFLRRCLYLELTFPNDPKDLATIVEGNLKVRREDKLRPAKLSEISEAIIETAVKSFLEIRKQAEANKATKLPATAELIDWVHILHWEQVDPVKIDGTDPPFWKTLFSTAPDILAHTRSIKASSGETPSEG